MRNPSPIPPQEPEAERYIIGILLSYDHIREEYRLDVDSVRSSLPPTAFYDPECRETYEAIMAVHDKGEPMSWVNVRPRLPDGVAWDNWLIDVTEGADYPNGEFYVRKVRDAWTLRRLIELGDTMAYEAYGPGGEGATEFTDGRELIANYAAKLTEIEKVTISDRESATLCDGLRTLANPANEPGQKVPTGLGFLDYLLAGGLERGGLCIVGGRPSTGKTSLGLTVTVNAAESSNGCPVLFVSAEMTARQVFERAMSMLTGVPLQALRRGDYADASFSIERDKAVIRAEGMRPVYVLESVVEMRAICAQARQAIRQQQVGLVVVDYLGRLRIAGDYDRHDLRIGAMTSAMKDLALEENVAVMLLTQLNRASAREGRPPTLSDLKDSGCIEADADTVICIERGESSGDSSIVPSCLHLLKHRQGDIGHVRVQYNRATLRYLAAEVSRPDGPAVASGYVPF